MPFWKWIAGNANANASADPTINWAEGQPPSSVNDSSRAMMARLAEWRNDISGALLTTNTSTNYQVTSNQVFDSLNNMDKALFVIVPHVTSGAAPTLNVDGLGAQAIRSVTGTALIEGVLIAGTPYAMTYLRSTTEFVLHNIAGNPYNVPLGAGMDYWGSVAPNSAFAIPTGQTINRVTYATLFAIIGTQYNTGGEAGTVFRLPDKSGRVSAMYEPSGVSRMTAAGWGGNSSQLGGNGGADSIILASTEIPAHSHPNSLNESPHTHGNSLHENPHTHANSLNESPHTHGVPGPGFVGTANGGAAAGAIDTVQSHTALSINAASTGITITNAAASTGVTITNAAASTGITITNANSTGGGNAHRNIQPTICCNYIIRVL